MLAIVSCMYSSLKQAFVLDSAIAEQLHRSILDGGLTVSFFWAEDYTPDDSPCDWCSAHFAIGEEEYVISFHISEFDALYQTLLLQEQVLIESQLDAVCPVLDRFELAFS